MSKKNNRTTRENNRQFALQREREAIEKHKKKQEKKKIAEESQQALASLSLGCASKPSPMQGLKSVTAKKMKRKPIKIKRNKMIRGIRITDSASKQKVRELLAAEDSMKEMAVE